MINIYYIILLAFTVMTIPLASPKLVFAHKLSEGRNYDALEGFKKHDKMAVIALFLVFLVIMVIFCVNKSPRTFDYQQYLRAFENTGSRNVRDMEMTYYWICRISPTFLWLLAIYATMSCFLHLSAILRNSPNIFLSMFIYMSFLFVLHDMIQIRAAVAAAILLWLVRFIVERKWYLFFPLALLAVLFHNSAVLFIPLYFIPRKRLNPYIWIPLVALILVLGFARFQIGAVARFIPMKIVNVYLENYMGSREYKAMNPGLGNIGACLVYIALIIRQKYVMRYYPYAIVCIVLGIVSQAFYLLCSDIPVLQGRMGELFATINIFGFAMVPMLSKKYYYVLIFIPICLALFQMQSTIGLFEAQ